MYTGRRKLLTGYLPKDRMGNCYGAKELNASTLAEELNRLLPIHQQNAMECEYLLKYYKGEQPILYREDKSRKANNKLVLNFANAIVRNLCGYTYANGIQYVSRDVEYAKEVDTINRFMMAENKLKITKVMADYQSICGTAFVGILPDTLEKNEVPFDLMNLSPLTTFVVYSTFNTDVPVFAGCYNRIEENKYILHIYTHNMQYIYEVPSFNSITAEKCEQKPHVLNEIPIIEYENNAFRLGDFEPALALLNGINTLASDCINNVEQVVLSYLILLGVEAPSEEELKQIKETGVMTLPNPKGVNQDAKFISAQLDGSMTETLRGYLETALKFIVGLPDRDVGQTGSDTGIASEIRTGSGDQEIVAKNKVMFTESAERRLLRAALSILKPKHIPEQFRVTDIDIEIPRNKNTNIQSKTQAGSSLYQMNVDKRDIAKVMDLTTDIEGFVRRWEDSEQQKMEKTEETNNSEKLLDSAEMHDKSAKS